MYSKSGFFPCDMLEQKLFVWTLLVMLKHFSLKLCKFVTKKSMLFFFYCVLAGELVTYKNSRSKKAKRKIYFPL